jgi:hypothetical protein
MLAQNSPDIAPEDALGFGFSVELAGRSTT